jgi:hypothetical protein
LKVVNKIIPVYKVTLSGAIISFKNAIETIDVRHNSQAALS